MRCGRGCELFLNGSSKQVRSLLSPFWDGQWTVRDCTQCISGAVLHFLLCWGSIRTADNAWICDLLDISISSLACVLYLVPCAGAHTRPLLTHRPRERQGKERVRTYCDSGWAGACPGRVQATGTGDRELGEGGQGGRDGGRGAPWRWELGTATRLGQDKRCGSATGPPCPPGLEALRPSGPQGPLFSVLSGPLPAPLARFNQPPGPDAPHCHGQSH